MRKCIHTSLWGGQEPQNSPFLAVKGGAPLAQSGRLVGPGVDFGREVSVLKIETGECKGRGMNASMSRLGGRVGGQKGDCGPQGGAGLGESRSTDTLLPATSPISPACPNFFHFFLFTLLEGFVGKG